MYLECLTVFCLMNGQRVSTQQLDTVGFQKRWAKQLAAGDPCMNPNFDLMKEDFSFDIKPLE